MPIIVHKMTDIKPKFRDEAMSRSHGTSLPNLPQSQTMKTLPVVPMVKPSASMVSLPKFDFVKDDQVDSLDPTLTNSSKKRHTLLQSPSTQSIQHSSLSLIDMYRDQSSGSQESDTATDVMALNVSGAMISEVSLINGSQSTFASAHDLLVLRNSRTNGSKVRLCIEESRTEISSNRDRYGFKKATNFITEEQYNNWWIGYASHCARRKRKWQDLMTKNGLSLNNDSPVRFPARSEKLKRYIRKGIPAEWRGNAWWFFAKGPEKLKNNQGVYDTLVESTLHLKNKDTEIIERDLNRTFPDNVHFKPDRVDSSHESNEETALIEALRRVLVAFSAYNPKIGYCQSLNFITGLLLIFMDEEKAFWMLVIITTGYLPGVHEVSLEGVNVDQGVLMLALKEYLPEAWNVVSNIRFDDQCSGRNDLKNHDFLLKLPPVTLCTSSWFMSAFIGILPIETTLRVWDCLFYEESNILFKVALSVFKLIEPKIQHINDEMEVFQVIQNTPKSILDPKDLFDIMFKRRIGFNNLTQDEVVRCKKYVAARRQRAHVDGTSDTGDVNFNRQLLAESLWQPDLYGFKRGLPGVHWNNNLTRKMKSKIRRNNNHS